jgi:hypothetical protein
MATIYTVKAECLTSEADQLENDAKQSLESWIYLGQGERYSAAMNTVRFLRAAAAERNLTTRREILRNGGYTVLTPKQASRA